MSAGTQPDTQRSVERALLRRACGLLSQQIWCWGQDILRPEGNWLIEIGFDRIPPPVDRDNCSSIYTLETPEGWRVVLRGFGVFYGDDRHGGVFLERYRFEPRYTTEASLKRPLWSSKDLPALAAPAAAQVESATKLTLSLIDWIRTYEERVADQLGLEYRQATLDKWQNTKRLDLPAEEIAAAWQSVRAAFAEQDCTLPA